MKDNESLDTSLRKLNVDGMIRFSIKANNSEENENIHTAFKAFCKAECDDNYTLGLKRLLENYETDYKYEMLFNEIMEVKADLAELAMSEKPKEQKSEAF